MKTCLSWIARLCGVVLACSPAAAWQEDSLAAKYGFEPHVKLTLTEKHVVVESDGVPRHQTANFPTSFNPNKILKQEYRFLLPREPKVAEQTTKLPMGPIGISISGVPFYNPYTREGNDAVEGPFAENFDSCCGHPDQLGRYHYHKYPVCVKSPFKDEAGKHSPIIGYAFDGFAIYGPNDEDGSPPKDLDACNGHSDKQRGYHYHVTAKFPYVLGAYRGEVPAENLDRRGAFAGGRQPNGPPPGKKRPPPPGKGPP